MHRHLSLLLSFTYLFWISADELEPLESDTATATARHTVLSVMSGQIELESTVLLTQKVRQPLADAIRREFQPVRHTIRVQAE